MPFSDAALLGLAEDGGLLLPASYPDVSRHLEEWAALPYPELAARVLEPFVDLPADVLRTIVCGACAAFRHPEVAPVVRVGDLHVLELFHGPTLAFKDIALQFLGRLFERLLAERGRALNLLAATSGDTGSAAIHAVRGRRGMRIFVLYPRGRISPVQELQMTTVPDANVHCLAVEGTFDDCQAVVKELLGDPAFRREAALGAVNSINWARLAPQVVYYFYSALRVLRETGAARVRFAVPTGNFGNVFAGWVAARMGLPVGKLVLATNENDVLCRFFCNGDYARRTVVPTPSPSMDIQAASNLERYLFHRLGADAALLRSALRSLAESGRLPPDLAARVGNDPLFTAGACGAAEALDALRALHAREGYLADPHTAVGVAVARRHLAPDEPMICLATAHPAKFPDAIRRATGDDRLARHPELDALAGRPQRRTELPASAAAVRDFIRRHV
jgi:threonine synthase